jgi:general secretion pathway protein D
MKFGKPQARVFAAAFTVLSVWPSHGAFSAAAVEDKYGVSSNAPVDDKPMADPSASTAVAATAPAPVDDNALIYLNATDVEVKDLIKQISKASGLNFLIDDKVRGKITIISEKPMTKDMAYQAFLSALQVMGYTTVETPGGLIKIVQTKEAINQPIELYKDSNPNTDKFITRIIQVRNISANDLSTVVKGLVSKDGNLFAYPSTNSLILTDSGSNIDRILGIIRELDQEGPQEVIEIIPIMNADAKDITDKILQLYEDEVNAKSGTTGGAAAARPRARRAAAGASAELEEAPSISKVISDERTNSIIILGSKRSIIKVRALIARLDAAVQGIEGSIHVYYLKHANAVEMSDVLSSLVSGTAKKTASKSSARSAAATGDSKAATTAATAAGGSVQLESDVKVTADESTNSLVITASPKDYETLIEKVVRKLDIPRRQVYLEAVVMEMSVNKQRTLGMQGNFGGLFGLGGETFTGFGALLPTFTSTIQSVAAASGGLTGGAFSNRTISFGSGDTAVEIPAVSTLIQALQTDSDVNVLSTPSVLTLDNEEAKIQVGDEVPVKSGTSLGSGGVQNFNVTREDTGIILTVTPQISESDTVRLEIAQEVSNIGRETADGPIFSKRLVETVVVADDKQTIVIGGLIDDQQSVTTAKVPYLGDIPVLGNLFKTRSNDKIKRNIIVFITPYIIREKADYLSILERKIEERNLFLDMNFGVGQRKQIRESIKNHAKDLLEYKGAVSATSPAYETNPIRENEVPRVTVDRNPEVNSRRANPGR